MESALSLSQFEAPTTTINMNDFLNSEVGYNHFLSFLKSEYSEENLLFWKAVENFHHNATNETAHQIYSEYIAPESPNEINISFLVRQAIERALSVHGCVSEHGKENTSEEKTSAKETEPTTEASSSTTIVDSCLFDEAQVEVSKLMQRDSLPRFQQTPLWVEYLTARF